MISIIIPSFNEEFKLIETLDALSQHIKKSILNIEIEIIVVDSSEDNTFDIIKVSRYYDKKQYKFIHSNKRLFPGDARNMGIEKSEYDIIVFVDSGFSFKENWLIRLIEPLLNNPEIDITWGVTETSIKHKKDRLVAYLVENKTLQRRILPNMAIRKKIFYDGHWFLSNLRAVEDTKFINEIKENYNEVFVDAINYYSGHPQSLVSAFRKWSNYSYYSIEAGYYNKIKLSILQYLVYILLIFSMELKLSIPIILILQILRVLYKSNKKYVIKFYEFFYIVLISFFIDFGRLHGSLKGLVKQIYNY